MKIYFKNLDGLRFFAAFIVLLHHAQYFKDINSFPLSSVFAPFLKEGGKMGVNLFFVLSGFLISYLLFSEKQKTGTIALKKFYIRRILRIWPLYLAYGLALILAAPMFFKLLGIQTDFIGSREIITNIIFLVFFAVNIQLTFFTYNKGIVEILWSVCVEEQFYLVWPLLVKKFFGKMARLIIILFAFALVSKIILHILHLYFGLDRDFMLLFDYVMLPNKVQLFAAGMAMAYLHFNKELYTGFRTFIQQKWFQWLVLLVTLVFVACNNFVLPVNSNAYYYLTDYISAILFGLLIYNVVQDNAVLNLEYDIFRTLGRISYGIYLFHPPVCRLVITFMVKVLKIPNSFFAYDILYFIIATAATAGLAWLSYEFFEKRFLKLKDKFAIIKTRI
ncbi:MAG TPA: acyltransferase [Ferruginibacter sp.]|nr:acyltransferase [Ferruginibacter sp.]HRE63475.1 acyltransferase [Ferruginibacter sp.]